MGQSPFWVTVTQNIIMQFIVSSKRTLSPFQTEVKTLGGTEIVEMVT